MNTVVVFSPTVTRIAASGTTANTTANEQIVVGFFHVAFNPAANTHNQVTFGSGTNDDFFLTNDGYEELTGKLSELAKYGYIRIG